MTFDDVRKIGRALPHVEEGTSWGTAALKVKKKFFVRLKEDGDSLVVGMPFEQREALMAEDPETYYITDHYRNAEYVLIRLSKVSKEALADLMKGAYRAALNPPPAIQRSTRRMRSEKT